MKFIHAADLHLDSPLRNLESYEGAPVDALRGATRRAFENLVNLAMEETVDFVLLAGDLYDGDWKDYNTGLFFHHQLSKLREANVEVIWLAGNHDAASEITRTLQAMKQLPNVHRLSERTPETVYLSALNVAVHGQGFATKAAKANLVLAYPRAEQGLFNIGLLHTSLDGRPGHDNYAPCKLNDLLSKGYDYWALGHIHQQEVIHQDPWVAFSGNIQGRHIGETGAKGCLLVSIENGKVQEVKPKSLDVLRWRRCRVDVTGAADEDMVSEQISTALAQDTAVWVGPEAVRLEITGACKAHAAINRQLEQWTNNLRARATDISNGRIWLEKVRCETEGVKSRDSEDGTGLLLRTLQAVTPDDPIIKRLEKEQTALKAALPAELRDESWLQIEHQETFATLREDVIRLLLPRLGSE